MIENPVLDEAVVSANLSHPVVGMYMTEKKRIAKFLQYPVNRRRVKTEKVPEHTR